MRGKMPFSPSTVVRLITLWPPYLFAGIRVLKVSQDLSHIRVGLKCYFWNQNYFGTHFGGSLYSMCDPFFVFMVAHHMAKDHIIWDKSAEIEFVKAVSRPVHVDFKISEKVIAELKQQALDNFSVDYDFKVAVVNAAGETIAHVKKKLYIRRKDAKERFKK